MKSSDIEKMLTDVQVYGEKLTEWEENFIASIALRFKQKGALSGRQVEILERIYADKTPTGTSFGGKKFTSEPVTDLPSERLKNRSRRYD
jgi:hypothetical protein